MTHVNGGKTQERHFAQGDLVKRIVEESAANGYSLFELAHTLLGCDFDDFTIAIGEKRKPPSDYGMREELRKIRETIMLDVNAAYIEKEVVVEVHDAEVSE